MNRRNMLLTTVGALLAPKEAPTKPIPIGPRSQLTGVVSEVQYWNHVLTTHELQYLYEHYLQK